MVLRILFITENRVIHLIWKGLYSEKQEFLGRGALVFCAKFPLSYHLFILPTESQARRPVVVAGRSSLWLGGRVGKA